MNEKLWHIQSCSFRRSRVAYLWFWQDVLIYANYCADGEVTRIVFGKTEVNCTVSPAYTHSKGLTSKIIPLTESRVCTRV